MKSTKFSTVSEYLAAVPAEAKAYTKQMRSIIRKVVPNAEEVISYNMPAFRLNGILVWYAGYKKHIGFYPKTTALQIFKDELTKYKTSKGAVQFPLDEPLPVKLIEKIVRLRVKEDS